MSDDLHPGRRITLSFAAVVLVAFLVLAVMGYAIRQNRELAREGEAANTALCALRVDLDQRVASSRAFLRENPEGIPGIPPKLIRDGIANQQRTIATLAILDCS